MGAGWVGAGSWRAAGGSGGMMVTCQESRFEGLQATASSRCLQPAIHTSAYI